MTLQHSMGMAADAISAQSQRMQVHASNMANIDTPGYKRKIPVLTEDTTISFPEMLSNMRSGVIHTGAVYSAGSVQFSGVLVDTTPGKKVYSPSHPEADKDGYITLSNVNPVSDLVDATVTGRAYEANLSVIGIVKQMANRAIEIGRG